MEGAVSDERHEGERQSDERESRNGGGQQDGGRGDEHPSRREETHQADEAQDGRQEADALLVE